LLESRWKQFQYCSFVVTGSSDMLRGILWCISVIGRTRCIYWNSRTAFLGGSSRNIETELCVTKWHWCSWDNNYLPSLHSLIFNTFRMNSACIFSTFKFSINNTNSTPLRWKIRARSRSKENSIHHVNCFMICMSSHFVTFGAQISWSLKLPFLLWIVFWTLFLESESFLKPLLWEWCCFFHW